jgi:hypothetical protein
MPRGGRRARAGRKKGGKNRTVSDKEMQTFRRAANRLADGTDNDLRLGLQLGAEIIQRHVIRLYAV